MTTKRNESAGETLVKHTVAERLRAEIATGGLRPGTRIVEGTWSHRLGVAQGSVREAIHLLAQDGFVTKASGRSARVVNLSESDVSQIFALRGVLEGLAARIVAQSGIDITPLSAALKQMRKALKEDSAEQMIDSDLAFHLELCRLSGNAYLLEHARRVILPLFAFARIRVLGSGQSAEAWGKDMDVHQRIVDLIREGSGDLAEQYVHHAMRRFSQSAYGNWEKQSSTSGPGRKQQLKKAAPQAPGKSRVKA